MRYFTFIIVILLGAFQLNAQEAETEEKRVIQFSGKVVTEGFDGKITPLPFTNVYIKNTSRGTASAWDGFFSIVARVQDTVVFSQIGFETVEYIIPDSLDQDLYYWIQIMSQDDVLLPEAVIRPYPSREFFKLELLEMEIMDDLAKNYEQYLANEILREIRYNLPVDGREATKIYLNETVQSYRYEGQIKPQNVFNPLAWKKFIDAWKRGDFKKKDKKDKK